MTKQTVGFIDAGAAGSHSLKNLGPKIVTNDFNPASMVDLQLKDLHLAVDRICLPDKSAPARRSAGPW